MFFRRQQGRYRETDRVTRFKLIKSGKHWLRASTSQFGLFKVLRGGVDKAQIVTEVVEEDYSGSRTGVEVLKGIVAAGAVLGGGIATQAHTYANEQTAVEKVVDHTDNLVNTDKVILGSAGPKNDHSLVSNDTSQSASETSTASDSVSLSQSTSASTSASVSASTSQSESVSTSRSESTSVSESDSISTSSSLSGSAVVDESQSVLSDANPTVTEKSSETVAPRGVASATDLKVTTSLSSNISSTENLNSQYASLTATTTATLAASTDAASTAKKTEENRKKLVQLSAEMGEYLAKAVGLPNADSAITKVNAAVVDIEKALTDPTGDLTAVVQTATVARDAIADVVSQSSSNQDLKEGETTSQDSSTPSKVLLDQNLSEAEILIKLASSYSLKVDDLGQKASLNAAIAKVQFEITNSDRLLKSNATIDQYVQQREQLGNAVDALMSALHTAGFKGNTTVNGNPAIATSLDVAVGETKLFTGSGTDTIRNKPIYYKVTVSNDGRNLTFTYTITYDNPNTSNVEKPGGSSGAIYNTITSMGTMFTLGSGYGTPSSVDSYLTDTNGNELPSPAPKSNTSIESQGQNGYTWANNAQLTPFYANQGAGLTSRWTVPIKASGDKSFTFSPYAGPDDDNTFTNFFNNQISEVPRGKDMAPTIELPRQIEVFNDDDVRINMVYRDDIALKDAGFNQQNPTIKGLTAKNYPAMGFVNVNKYGRPLPGHPYKEWTTTIYGTIGRVKSPSDPKQPGTYWNPMDPGSYSIVYSASDTSDQWTNTTMNVVVRGFNERQDPVSGAIVGVKDPTSLT